jgi:hypothetical protein
LDTPHIGDFADLGLQYATISEMSAGRLPFGETLARQISQNKCVARTLEVMSEDGLMKIGDMFQILTDRENQAAHQQGREPASDGAARSRAGTASAMEEVIRRDRAR